MAFCDVCNENFDDGVKCPKCGKVIASKGTKTIAAIITVFIIFIVIYFVINTISSLGDYSDATSSILSKTTDNGDKYEVVEAPSGSNDMFSIYITGALRNKTNKTYAYAQITFNLYDENEYHIGTAIANVNNWEAGGVWKYKAIGLSPDGSAKSYKFANVTMF